MDYVSGVDREQQVLFPEVLDEYVGEENQVRFIDAFVSQLDLEVLGFAHATAPVTGRPPYHPGDLLRLYIYGYLHKIRSSRKLERETHRNVELLWLLRKLQPDHKTIAEFRRTNPKALKRVCREFTVLCKRLDLFAGELIAIDGSKFRAVNSKARNYTRKDLRRLLKAIDRKIGRYLGELDTQDATEAAVASPSRPDLQQQIATLQERQAEYQGLLTDLDEADQEQVSLTDSDSRRMKSGPRTEVSYNVQTAVEAKHKLIVAHDVTNDGTDHHQLSPMVQAAQEVLQAETLTVVADRGYYNGSEIKACVDAGVTPLVPKAQTSGNRKRGLFTKDAFRYDRARDCYHCPAGATLTNRSAPGGRYHRYRTPACGGCALKAQCTRNKQGRCLERWEHEGVLDAMARGLARRPDTVRHRACLAEHPFGTMKRGMDQGYFLLRGLEKVKAEFSLTVLAYNLKRVTRIVGVPRLLAAVA
ncbi:MAG: IS1182 family transposase [Gemmatimonadetes bacterium]|nr:IS1182 family transposase [Gemmatimonadota bacterium]